MEPLIFPNLKASTLELNFLHSLNGFWPVLLKIRSEALLWHHLGLFRYCCLLLDSDLPLPFDKSKLQSPAQFAGSS